MVTVDLFLSLVVGTSERWRADVLRSGNGTCTAPRRLDARARVAAWAPGFIGSTRRIHSTPDARRAPSFGAREERLERGRHRARDPAARAPVGPASERRGIEFDPTRGRATGTEESSADRADRDDVVTRVERRDPCRRINERHRHGHGGTVRRAGRDLEYGECRPRCEGPDLGCARQGADDAPKVEHRCRNAAAGREFRDRRRRLTTT